MAAGAASYFVPSLDTRLRQRSNKEDKGFDHINNNEIGDMPVLNKRYKLSCKESNMGCVDETSLGLRIYWKSIQEGKLIELRIPCMKNIVSLTKTTDYSRVKKLFPT